MLVITGFFNDEDRFIPDKPIKVPQNMKVKLTIEEEIDKSEKQRRMQLLKEARKLIEESKDEILPDDFPEQFKWFSTSKEIEL